MDKYEKLNKSFCIRSVCRADIVGEKLMSEEEALALNDGKMEYIADKMGEGFLDYWGVLKDAVELLKEK